MSSGCKDKALAWEFIKFCIGQKQFEFEDANSDSYYRNLFTYGSMLNPGLVHNAVIAKLAGVQITDVIANHMLATVVGVIIAAAVLTVLAVVLKENRGFAPEGEAGVDENFGINPLFAVMPLVPVIILLLGSTKLVPALKMGVPHAMVIGAILSLAVTRKNPVELT